jgi:hypothetical protein
MTQPTNEVEPAVVRIPWAAPLPSVGTQLDTTHGSGVVVGTGGEDRWELFVDLRLDVPAGQDQELDGGEAPAGAAPPFVPLSQPPVMWRRIDFDTEPEPPRPSRVTIPEAEYALILAVVAAARQWRAQVDSPSRVLRADSHHALVAAVDALPPQADPLREATEAVERSRQREAGLDMDRIERVRRLAGGEEVTDVT